MIDPRFFSLGESAVTVEFGSVISVELNEIAVALSDNLTNDPFPGFVESVPAYASTSVFYDIAEVRQSFAGASIAFDAVIGVIKQRLADLDIASVGPQQIVEIPVSFDPKSGPDFDLVAERSGLARDTVIEIFTNTVYRVFLLGFLPGFSYMGEVDARIATPRRRTPRSVVPKGSVGIAGRQTGIYSLASPGGWQIIGRTSERLFDAEQEPLVLLQPGDVVSFRAI